MKLKLYFAPKTGKPAAGETLAEQIVLESIGNKEEQFFDSQPWLESDCDDDFFSVNGDSTLSHGNTPVHYNSSIGSPQRGKGILEEGIPGSSPTYKKKRLFELFLENIEEDLIVNHQVTASDKNMANAKMKVAPTLLHPAPRSPYSDSYVSGTNSLCSSERTPNIDSINKERKSIGSMHCCLPRLVSGHRFNERKKRMM